MIVEYDYETKITEYKCESCGYVLKTKEEKYQKYSTYESKIVGDEDFIELGQTDIIKKGDYYERIEKTTLYACPKCGCVHIKI